MAHVGVCHIGLCGILSMKRKEHTARNKGVANIVVPYSEVTIYLFQCVYVSITIDVAGTKALL